MSTTFPRESFGESRRNGIWAICSESDATQQAAEAAAAAAASNLQHIGLAQAAYSAGAHRRLAGSDLRPPSARKPEAIKVLSRSLGRATPRRAAKTSANEEICIN